MLKINEIIAKGFMASEKVEVINGNTYVNKDHTLFMDEEKMVFSSNGHVFRYWKVDGKTRRKDVTSEAMKAMMDIVAAHEEEPNLEDFLNKVASHAMADYVGCGDAIDEHIISIMKMKLKEKYDADYVDNSYEFIYDAGQSEMSHFARPGHANKMIKSVIKEVELK